MILIPLVEFFAEKKRRSIRSVQDSIRDNCQAARAMRIGSVERKRNRRFVLRKRGLPDKIWQAHFQGIHRAFNLAGQAVPAGLVDFAGPAAVQTTFCLFPRFLSGKSLLDFPV
jgi:hypothetical protein